jgi:hypothetical protein
MQLSFAVRATAVALTLFGVSFASFPSLPHPALKQPAASPTVNRALKGDRLPVTGPGGRSRAIGQPLSEPQSAEKILAGCDAAFSALASPRSAPVFGRCAV